MNKTLIIARYEEDISWKEDPSIVPPGIECFVVQKGKHMKNVGRDAGSHLWYITNYYDNLGEDDLYYFVKGDPFDCCEQKVFTEILSSSDTSIKFMITMERFKRLECSLTGAPHHKGLPIKRFTEEAGFSVPENIIFTASGQFRILGSLVKSQPLSLYKKFLDLHYKYEKAAWIMERLWGLMYGYVPGYDI